MDRRAFLTVAATAMAGCGRLAAGESPTGVSRSGEPTGSPTSTLTATGSSIEASSSTETTSPTGAASKRIAPTGPQIRLEQVATGLRRPVGFVTPQDAGDLAYVLERTGQVLALDRSTGETAAVVDVSSKLVRSRSWEQGLLGIALHPAFASNRRFYLRYSAPLRQEAPEGYSHTFVLSEFRMDEGGITADPASERLVLEIPEPGPIHNGGGIAFGPDGYLYVGVGDGGGGHYDQGPGHVEDWYDAVAGGNGQDVTENLLGSILRIDVDERGPSAGQTESDDRDGAGSASPSDRDDSVRDYAVPEDNPLVGDEGLDEHFAWGFRNPYRFSFDDGDIFVGDVGQDSYEEVNVVRKGGNYGWNVREGPGCVKRSTCPSETPGGSPLLDPILSYPHEIRGGRTTAVVGGYRYQNDTVSALADTYVFGDLFTAQRGHLFAATPPETEDGSWSMAELVVANRRDGFLREAVLGFGTDNAGELYVLTTAFEDRSGSVYRIAPA